MQLTIDIAGRVDKIQKELKPNLFELALYCIFKYIHIGFATWLLKARLRKLSLEITRSFDSFNTTSEELLKLVPTLNHEEALKSIGYIREAIKSYEVLVECLVRLDYIGNSILKQKTKIFLKTLFKVEARLHFVINKNNPVTPTPDYIKEGLIKMSQQAILEKSKV